MVIKKKLKISDYEDYIKLCSNCSMCREVCPTYLISRKESKFAGGRMRILRTFIEEGLKFSGDFIEMIAFCTTCKRCEEICPIELDYVEILEKIRKDIINKAKRTIDKQNKFIPYLVENKNPYGEPQQNRMIWMNKELNITSSGKYAYFVGCTSSYRAKECAINTAKILSKILKEGFVLLKEDEYCCGSPYLRTGLVDLTFSYENQLIEFHLEDYIKQNINTLKERGVKKIIFNCAGCYKTAKNDWGKFTESQLPFQLIHLSEFIVDKLKKKEIDFKKWPKKITYHDPCHLGRHMGIYDEPRKILNAIPAVKLIEMEHTRQEAICCGAGGGFKAGFPEDSLEIAKIRIKEALKTGAEIIATSCVFCKNQLNLAIQKMNKEIKVLNIEDIVADRIQ
ncbi:MAG: CoB--CoM heterodisulfide reductase iron-sulfur subunit D [Promethearchaeota archaeon]|nr:MAG: CoB--CoM heterodisulfide reductase iron-sulfur subunit D [Candidatus Lokiarchaeota archaeon]